MYSMCVFVYLTQWWYVYSLDHAFPFHEYVGDYPTVVQIKLPHLFKTAAT